MTSNYTDFIKDKENKRHTTSKERSTKTMSDKFIFLLANLLDVYSVDYSDELVRRLHYAMQGLIQQFGLGKDYYNYFFKNIVGDKKTTKQLLEMLLEECQEEKGERK